VGSSQADSEAAPVLKVLAADDTARGMRLDQWLAAALAPDHSRSRVQALIREGAVSLDGRTVTEPKFRLTGTERAELKLPAARPTGMEVEAIPLSILYEDEHLIVVDKPAGLVVHPGAGNWTGTLVNALLHHCGASLSGIGGAQRPGIVHRLDKDTSGVIVVAKTDLAHRALSDAFADHGRSAGLERAYVAIVWGAPQRSSGVVDAALGRAADRVRRAVVPAGRADARHAVTRYRVLERFGPGPDFVASMLECRLETGRTHQIRVHMAHVGHPLIGDPDYGRAFRTRANRLGEPARSMTAAFPRQALHAGLLAFVHPVSGAVMRFEAPLPPDMVELAAALRGSA
jgi:23S rRNA pseudouridine1911/1915/1917 synthase